MKKQKYRKKRRQHERSGFVIPVPLGLLLLLIAVVALSYLWLCGKCEALGHQISELEVQKKALHRKVVNEEYEWSNLTSPENMQRSLKRHKLEMDYPAPDRMVKLPRVRPELVNPEQLYAQSPGGSLND